MEMDAGFHTHINDISIYSNSALNNIVERPLSRSLDTVGGKPFYNEKDILVGVKVIVVARLLTVQPLYVIATLTK